MGIFGPSWHTPRSLPSLRSLLWGGAAAVAWLALSSPAANADAGTHPGSILGGLSSVSSVTSAAGDAISAVPSHSRAVNPSPAPSPASGPNGMLQPVVGSLTGTADNPAGSIPVINQVVPDGVVSNAVSPVSAAVDDAASGLAETVILSASETVPALQPVLDPVAEVISGGDVALPEPVVGVVTGLVGEPALPRPILDDPGAGGDATAALPDTADFVSSVVFSTGTAPLGTGFAALWMPSMSLGDTSGEAAISGVAAPYGGGNGPPGSKAVPSVPGSGSGSGHSSGGPSGGAACLPALSLNLPKPGSTPASGPLQHAPAPMSFDPGSSPD